MPMHPDHHRGSRHEQRKLSAKRVIKRLKRQAHHPLFGHCTTIESILLFVYVHSGALGRLLVWASRSIFRTRSSSLIHATMPVATMLPKYGSTERYMHAVV
jgi:hypothetical protein